jgi:GntR family transcriptional regulator
MYKETDRKILSPGRLNRSSFVPLYYQLQELLKEQIESGRWAPGEALPSEPDLARLMGVSRVVVRQALQLLADDRQIVRQRGRGTFVAKPKLDHRAGGLSRLLAAPRERDVSIQVLEKRLTQVEPSVRDGLGADDEPIMELTTLLALSGQNVAIGYSFFRAPEVEWLDAAAQVGREIPREVILSDHGIELTRSSLSVETTHSGRFDADHFGIPPRSAVFLVLCREFRRFDRGERPFEVARVEYRGDTLQFRLELGVSEGVERLEAIYSTAHPDGTEDD